MPGSDKYVLGLDVSVVDVFRVGISDSAQQLVGDPLLFYVLKKGAGAVRLSMIS